MVARASWLLLALPAVPLLCLQLRSAGLCPGWKDIFLLGGRGLLFLAVLTLIVLVTTPWLTSHTPSQVCPTVTEDENKRRQKRARKQQQETLRSQSSEYLENILKPRQEMKLRKQQERFYQMMGESWKAQDGHKLGGHEEPRSRLAQDDGAPGDTPNKEASKRRKLPEPVTCESASAGQQPRVKKVLVLPEEPPETAKEVVAVALRCPDGRVCRRRFHTWWRSQKTSGRRRPDPGRHGSHRRHCAQRGGERTGLWGALGRRAPEHPLHRREGSPGQPGSHGPSWTSLVIKGCAKGDLEKECFAASGAHRGSVSGAGLPLSAPASPRWGLPLVWSRVICYVPILGP